MEFCECFIFRPMRRTSLLHPLFKRQVMKYAKTKTPVLTDSRSVLPRKYCAFIRTAEYAAFRPEVRGGLEIPRRATDAEMVQ